MLQERTPPASRLIQQDTRVWLILRGPRATAHDDEPPY